MQIPSKYDPSLTENKWYQCWMEKGFFRSEPDEREPYCIVIPPPNVTGVLHMGHILNNTLQDVLVRRARMQGKNALWLPGTDHASIATEAKVVAHLKEKGIDKKNLSRSEFLQHAWEWKEKHGGIILEQLKKLGASCDWERTRFTMDQSMYESVIDVFIDLYNKGLIYRGVRMVNWDPAALTALSDEEVVYQEENSKLYYVRYRVENEDDQWVTIATTRPETILGDTAVCVNPNDKRFISLAGKRVLVPLVNRPVPIIQDEYVDMEFGTGCLKITPAHDINDYEIGIRHKLDTIDIFNDNGTLNEAAQLYVGEDRDVVRRKIVKDLDAAGNLVKVEDYQNKVGYSERTHVAIEPKLSLQWFLKMAELAQPALEVVMADTIAFHPKKFKNTYRHWMENVRDWCISRQLWWGQRIPVYYLPNREMVVAKSAEKALQKAQAQYPELENLAIEDVKQDEDVLDTWFSSWLWPISVFDGIRHPDNPDIKYYYPTNDLVTAPEILFFWVARMIMAGLEYRGEIPFKNVYLTGIVRDKQGRKMSKSLGNSPDPVEMMKQYGADGTRVGMLFTSPAGNDLPFDVSLCEQGRNFSNKIWNALRLVKGWEIDSNLPQPENSAIAADWFGAQFNDALKTIDEHYAKYRISDALMATYKLIWDDFCSWYLEMIKPAYQQPVDAATYEQTIKIFENLMKVLHPFMPFLTEEVWHLLADRAENDCIIIAPWPERKRIHHKILDQFDFAKEVVNAARNVRAARNIPQKEALDFYIKKNLDQQPDTTFDGLIAKLCNLRKLEYVDEKVDNALSFVVRSTEFYIPLTETVDVEAEIKKLHDELVYTQGFHNSVMKKLSNERFVNNAPEAVVAGERKKLSDAENKIKVITDQIAALQG
ncbi:MAG: valine--tRNA ligase [Bacteroidales bacterium]|jgi:valyl-tRNA synthetase|nr:valine--tRNA ligase [Bacteroidales bacterium]MDD4177392.1 valine--tRNA ligase [Bacteroidales bacterium]MDD4741307.1 valine--tRNA ligase [Bacteroidales bacterium]MDY0335097.1 valine--tRNA ligase [Bacteroidales bacterium]NCU34979.1 valine--tRNA ligase [Candidatus Falkowbacteria bacterium]